MLLRILLDATEMALALISCWRSAKVAAVGLVGGSGVSTAWGKLLFSVMVADLL
jgi:hypothetical protein